MIAQPITPTSPYAPARPGWQLVRGSLGGWYYRKAW
jgi:hypothetical protein